MMIARKRSITVITANFAVRLVEPGVACPRRRDDISLDEVERIVI
jgi:hypothetical protein